nr:discoidin domain-containing receptor 2 isoform X2 [Halyomorpha halys]
MMSVVSSVRVSFVFSSVFVILSATVPVRSLELVRCIFPLGMESMDIPDSAISASSSHDAASVGPQNGRLRHDKNGGAWCPKNTVTKETYEHLEIDLGRLTVVTGTRTQGRFGNGQGQEFAEEFFLDYWRPGFTRWRRWRSRQGKQMLEGNTNTYTVVEQKIDPVIVATKVRFIPYSVHFRTVCMRVEIIGCPWNEGVLSYSMPQGERSSEEDSPDLRDNSYDGTEEGGWLSGGLGQLIDGHLGQDNFNADVFGHGKGYEWVGWRNDSFGMNGRPLEMVFEFDRLRNFSAMYLHTNNIYSQKVQVFSAAKIYMSVGGRMYSGAPIHSSYIPDVVLEHARNVTVKLHHMVGRFIKLQLYFASKWLMISEVSFDSVIVPENISEEEIENNFLAGVNVEQSKDIPLQRDAVHTTPSKEETRRPVSSIGSAVSTNNGGKEPDNKQMVGFLIGALTGVILLLMAAISFIVFRQRRQKAGQPQPTDDFQIEKNIQVRCKVNSNGHVYGQVSIEDPEKSILYHEPFMNHMNLCSFQNTNQPVQRNLNNPDYSEDYAVPLVGNTMPPGFHASNIPPTPMRTLPPLHNFFPSPPPVPPPPEKYYAATEICPQKPPPPLSSPPSVAASSSTSSYGQLVTSTEGEGDRTLREISRRDLKYVSKLGVGQFGEVHLFEWIKMPQWLKPSSCKSIVVKVLRKGSSEKLREEFHQEVGDLLPLHHENLSRVLGACLEVEPLLLVLEYAEHGDLYQFLQNYVAESAGLSTNANVLSYGCLIYMATQVAAGMKYLEQQKFLVLDLATRNCIVGNDYSVKIADLGIGRSVYPADYFELPGRGACPIRWMSWESILLDKYTLKSVVWSFAVTLWEILTFAREQPFEDLTDEKVVENAKLFEKPTGKPMLLPQPYNCHKEIYDLMCECWQRKELDRPSFKEIHMFLQRKNLGYKHNIRKS